MVVQVVVDVMALVWQHPVFSCLVLVLFTPPFFPIVKFFSPLLVSTALFMLALFTMGPGRSDSSLESSESGQGDGDHQQENWEFRRAAHVKVWEDKSVDHRSGSTTSGVTDRRWKDAAEVGSSCSWVDDILAWLSGVQEAGLAWVEAKFRNENWKGISALNDDNVSILQEAAWDHVPSTSSSGVAKEEDQVVAEQRRNTIPAVLAPSALFKVESNLKRDNVVVAASSTPEMGEDAPAVVLEPLKVVRHASSVQHEPLVHLQLGDRQSVTAAAVLVESPSTDLDDSSDLERSRRFLNFATVRRNSLNASSGQLSDADTPAATLSKSGKLKQIETLGDFIIEDYQARSSPSSPSTDHHHPHHEQLAILKPTTAEQVDAVKEKLDDFTHDEPVISKIPGKAPSPPNQAASAKIITKAPDSPLFKEPKGAGSKSKKNVITTTTKTKNRSSEFLDSGSESEFEIFPPVDPKKMKLHPPVKLDIQHLEKKLGTSLSQLRTRRS